MEHAVITVFFAGMWPRRDNRLKRITTALYGNGVMLLQVLQILFIIMARKANAMDKTWEKNNPMTSPFKLPRLIDVEDLSQNASQSSGISMVKSCMYL